VDGALLFVIETISHLARVLSLTVRLYANMFAGDLLTLVFFSLIPIGVPVIFLGLHVLFRSFRLRIHAPDHDLSLPGGCARTLRAAISC